MLVPRERRNLLLSPGGVGIVVIARNEGERLIRCFDSIVEHAKTTVYVDSGSTDGSVAEAKRRGIEVVELDMSIPFTAARARNAGFERLTAVHPSIDLVQFVDGDCEVVGGWIRLAEDELRRDTGLAAVCGRRRERFKDESIYNLVCDVEWNTPIGDAEEIGGDAMVRAEAFRSAGGYNPTIIAAEDSELGVRLRKLGYKLLRVDADMTIHDAAIHHFKQWWLRTVRAGHGFANIHALHGGPPLFHRQRETRSAWFWGLGVPAMALSLLPLTIGLSVPTATLGYVRLYWKIHKASLERGLSEEEARAFAFFTTLAKFPEALGQMKYWNNRLRKRTSRIIEYKQ
jgi:cellulose synthase/poly-beta-1,6-N-acetylglucosamine synthase-like glycosyltransferase